MDLGGELVKNAWASDLDIAVTEMFLVTAETVRIENQQTLTIRFDTEDVSVETQDIGSDKLVEAFAPDYGANNPGNVLFVDSPCVRRWEKLTARQGAHSTQLFDDFCSTPMSGSPGSLGCPGGSPPYGVPEAVYVIDLEVEAGATLIAGVTSVPVKEVNIYYTGVLTGVENIVDRAGLPYVPVRLTPTAYGDFNGDGEGNDDPAVPGNDTYRFNQAFCTCAEFDARYDPLVDWNCDGFIDNTDRDQYNANWKNPAGLTTGPCSPGFCGT